MSGQSNQGVDPQRLENDVRMLSETLAPRDSEHPDSLERVAAYIRQQFELAGGIASEQTYFANAGPTSQKKAFHNVISSIGPRTKERIVIGAHYDTDGPFPGADDNASGIAGLLELARLLNVNPPAIQADLVAYTLEERPYFATSMMGSAVHAAALKASGTKVRAMLCLEMIGYFSDQPNSQKSPFFLKPLYPAQGNFLLVVGKLGGGLLARKVRDAMRRASPLPVYYLQAPKFVVGIENSDHRSFWQEGYPAVMLTDTAFYRNPYYHTREDTAGRLDYQRMALVVKGLFEAVHELCASPEMECEQVPLEIA